MATSKCKKGTKCAAKGGKTAKKAGCKTGKCK